MIFDSTPGMRLACLTINMKDQRIKGYIDGPKQVLWPVDFFAIIALIFLFLIFQF